MGFKRQFCEGNNNDFQNPVTKFHKGVNYVLKDESLQELATKISAMLEPTLRKVVKEEMELFFNLQSIPRRSLALQPNTIPTRNLQLIFANKLPSILFTNSKVEDEDHDPLKIQLVDAVSQCVIDHGSLSGIKIEIVVLNGDFVADGREDWSENEFNDNIVREREGKRPLLVGDLSFVLVGGVGYIQNITFTDNSSWLRSRKFRLGVRVVSRASLGTGIREAVSEAFMVLDHRGESYQKHHTPSLDDPIWRLKKISKQGASHKKLESKGIKTVKDFLMQYYLDPLSLRQVLGKGVANKTWETMVKHANECHLDNTFYSYQVSGVQLLFNCVYKIVAVKFEGQDYRSVSTLDTSQKALVKMYKQSAFYNLDQLVPVQNPFATSTPVPPTIEQNTSFSSSKLDFQHDALSIVDQDKQLDINLSDSVTYPGTIEDGYRFEDDTASQTNQSIQDFHPAFMMGDASAGPSNGVYNWYQNSPIATFSQYSQFEELSHLQTTPIYPFVTNGGQEDDFLITATPTHIGFSSRFPDSSVDISGTGKSRAGWCKIRAAVMWKIVRRNAAARRKAKFSFGYL
ncbi:unnamed protein product [Amaranthus hypochondriacus]